MPSEIALNLSTLELLEVLNEKLASECTRARGIRPARGPTFFATLEAEVGITLIGGGGGI